MISAKLAGAVILGVPLIVLAWAILWRRLRPVFWFAVAAILVGIGYLMATGATDDIARSILPGSAQHMPSRGSTGSPRGLQCTLGVEVCNG